MAAPGGIRLNYEYLSGSTSIYSDVLVTDYATFDDSYLDGGNSSHIFNKDSPEDAIPYFTSVVTKVAAGFYYNMEKGQI